MRSPCTTMKSSPCSLQLEKTRVQQQRPNTAKNKINKFIFFKNGERIPESDIRSYTKDQESDQNQTS